MSMMICNAIPIGGIYEADISIPFYGNQNIKLNIVSESNAHIYLNGLITTDGEISYTFSNSKFEFELTPKVQYILNKFHCHIADAEYNSQGDVASIIIGTPIFIKKRVKLHRKIIEKSRNFFPMEKCS